MARNQHHNLADTRELARWEWWYRWNRPVSWMYVNQREGSSAAENRRKLQWFSPLPFLEPHQIMVTQVRIVGFSPGGQLDMLTRCATCGAVSIGCVLGRSECYSPIAICHSLDLCCGCQTCADMDYGLRAIVVDPTGSGGAISVAGCG